MGRASSPYKNVCHVSQKFLFSNKWKKKTDMELANVDSPRTYCQNRSVGGGTYDMWCAG